MQNLKFRAWDNENEYMITSMQGIYTALRNTMNITRQDDGYYNTGDLLKPNKEKYSIMQYTGLKDKEKKEMYEGDIVEIKVYDSFSKQCISTKKCVIEFKNGIFGVMFTKAQELTAFVHFTNTTFEVIGNIYENKELLSEVENWK